MPSAVITGADRGLGLSLSKELLSRGWRVFAGKYLEDYNLLEDLAAREENLCVVPMDVSRRDSIERARDAVAEKVDTVDMIISNAALMGAPPEGGQVELFKPPMALDFTRATFTVNALGALLLTDIFLPLMGRSDMRRLCYISSEVSSVTMMQNRSDGAFSYPMSKSALNMAVRLMYNRLFPEYTFRLYQPGWMRRVMPDGTRDPRAEIDPDLSAAYAARYFTQPLADEQRLVLHDYLGQEWPF